MFSFTFTEEEDITFPPTYRFERDTHERYVYTKAKATGVLIFLVIGFSGRLVYQVFLNKKYKI